MASSVRRVLVLLAALTAGGCGSRACPLPAEVTDPEWGDANADGRVDVNDGVRIARHQLAAGPPPACRGQGDLLGTGDVAFDATHHLWDWLFLGHATAMPEWGGCEARQAAATEPPCARVSIRPDAPRKVTTPTFDVAVRLDAKGLDPGPDAWSFGVRADGCAITGTSFAGTAAATVFASPPGIVEEGFTHAELVADGAVTAVVPSWLAPVHLAEKDAAVLSLTVAADVPSSGCAPCDLTIVGDLQGSGQPVAAVVGFQGWSYEPTLGSSTTRVCAP